MGILVNLISYAPVRCTTVLNFLMSHTRNTHARTYPQTHKIKTQIHEHASTTHKICAYMGMHPPSARPFRAENGMSLPTATSGPCLTYKNAYLSTRIATHMQQNHKATRKRSLRLYPSRQRRMIFPCIPSKGLFALSFPHGLPNAFSPRWVHTRRKHKKSRKLLIFLMDKNVTTIRNHVQSSQVQHLQQVVVVWLRSAPRKCFSTYSI